MIDHEHKTIDYRTLRKCLTDASTEFNQRLHDSAFSEDRYVVDYIRIYDQSGLDNVVSLGVNWGAIGTVSPEKAKAFGDALVLASKWIAECGYNGYEILY